MYGPLFGHSFFDYPTTYRMPKWMRRLSVVMLIGLAVGAAYLIYAHLGSIAAAIEETQKDG